MTITQLAEIVRNLTSYGSEINIGDIIIKPIAIYCDRNKNKAFITSEMNPEGFFLYGDGEIVENAQGIDNLSNLPESVQDKLMIHFFTDM